MNFVENGAHYLGSGGRGPEGGGPGQGGNLEEGLPAEGMLVVTVMNCLRYEMVDCWAAEIGRAHV